MNDQKLQWLAALFYAMCIVVAVSFGIRGWWSAIPWVGIAAYNFYQTGKAWARVRQVQDEHLKDLTKFNELMKRMYP
jgi:hypothetical protein